MKIQIRTTILLTTIAIVAGGFFYAPTLVLAQYTVEPLVIDHTLTPRENTTSQITVRNTGSRLERVYATVNAVTLDGAGAIEEFTPRSQSDNRSTVTSWLAIDRGRIEIPPGESHQLTLEVSINSQVEPGVYHAFIGIASGRNREVAEERVRSGQAPGTIVRIEIAEQRTSYLRLDTFTVDRFVYDPDRSVVRYVVENPGDIAHTPQGEVIIYDTRGNELVSAAVNPEAVTIDPGATHTFTMPVPDTDRMGRHKAFLSLHYGQGQLATIQDTTFFFRIPLYHILILFFIVLGTVMLVAYLIHRRYAAVDDVEDDDAVAMYHRPGTVREEADHDIDLRSSKSQ